ncbi:hypothetical protein EVJ58_g7387 [Rhodofomes roseus]|uniref:Uncharacterized protein n=1 Tax=Rhodofomes roseus TaxID=34475 RepID=A0A4Y9Y2Z8_9APHY|nr:hypothetical protein EVJ58_g7387 [Rhodofomes roseus]
MRLLDYKVTLVSDSSDSEPVEELQEYEREVHGNVASCYVVYHSSLRDVSIIARYKFKCRNYMGEGVYVSTLLNGKKVCETTYFPDGTRKHLRLTKLVRESHQAEQFQLPVLSDDPDPVVTAWIVEFRLFEEPESSQPGNVDPSAVASSVEGGPPSRGRRTWEPSPEQWQHPHAVLRFVFSAKPGGCNNPTQQAEDIMANARTFYPPSVALPPVAASESSRSGESRSHERRRDEERKARTAERKARKAVRKEARKAAKEAAKDAAKIAVKAAVRATAQANVSGGLPMQAGTSRQGGGSAQGRRQNVSTRRTGLNWGVYEDNFLEFLQLLQERALEKNSDFKNAQVTGDSDCGAIGSTMDAD